MKNNSVNFRKSGKTITFGKDRVSVNERNNIGSSNKILRYTQLDKFIKEYK